MKQQKDEIFFQSSLFVAQLCEPLSILEYLSQGNQEIQEKPLKTEKLEKIEQPKGRSNRIIHPQKKDPYGSDWAQGILAKQFGVQITQGSSNLSPKWRLKKVQPLDFSQNVALLDPKTAKDFKTQEKLFRQTASESHRKRVGRVIKQYQQSFNGQIPAQQQQGQLLYQYKLPSIP
ncbi:unnamed protein product (macronuclear) [Paramecium tetraurelia]|uniref:MRPL25 domain-containing protein n=1 Tax=Paramecium tetraurelia TaxID=5888 RepID=A0DWI8_PARTE|nr:uncharacterized protein GSPATT00021048001 [Paramecium tetraurelia]CAK87405.1 unnamed protein product [Paramecium tetraurelia]|eukprot:XP_001454802.1 hypothetical protein (macronuclear) [Paramecium tetraurelia strain d4-2]